MATPPIDAWYEQVILRELARLVRDLPDIDADRARRRLRRLTDEQRWVVEGAITRLSNRLDEGEPLDR